MWLDANKLKMAGLCKKKDCRYYAKSVGSCDYRLIENKGRDCAVAVCDKYRKSPAADAGVVYNAKYEAILPMINNEARVTI